MLGIPDASGAKSDRWPQVAGPRGLQSQGLDAWNTAWESSHHGGGISLPCCAWQLPVVHASLPTEALTPHGQRLCALYLHPVGNMSYSPLLAACGA
jgi:hypothetical protein